MSEMELQKAVHTVVLDTGSIIKNEPPVSTLLSQAESLVTCPDILREIKDAATRSRVESTLKPFLNMRTPRLASIKFVMNFARRTGDLAVLSKPDIQIIALAYEIECERNGGDWRLRKVPGQKRVNGAPPAKTEPESSRPETSLDEANPEAAGDINAEESMPKDLYVPENDATADLVSDDTQNTQNTIMEENVEQQIGHIEAIVELVENASLETNQPRNTEKESKFDSVQNSAESQDDSDSDDWITPSNLKKKQAQEKTPSSTPADEPRIMQVGVLTTDFAMQNVILQMNLNLLSPSMTRVKHMKTFVLRCHACFQVTKDLSKQFCPRCGQPSLTRVSCSTNSNGEFKLHLKKNFQWNHRGDRYSIPKPVHGSSNGRVKGGGKGGWGNELILAEDQKEYQRAAKDEKKIKERSLMDEDYLPSILTGDRGRPGGRTKVGAGKNINSKKR
jgi:RNA-binding protein NOB1